jgi:hypothetical protein
MHRNELLNYIITDLYFLLIHLKICKHRVSSSQFLFFQLINFTSHSTYTLVVTGPDDPEAMCWTIMAKILCFKLAGSSEAEWIF